MGLNRHCERSEAIQKATRQELDCFVADAPRNDEDMSMGWIKTNPALTWSEPDFSFTPRGFHPRG
jgi:hypothetical protein